MKNSLDCGPQMSLFIHGFGGLIAPFAGIKLIDMVIAALGWA